MPLLPGTLGAPVDRMTGGGGTLGYPRLQPSDLRGVQGSAERQLLERRASSVPGAARPRPTDHVLARFDDGAVAMAERTVGQRPRDRVHVDARRHLERLPERSICSCRSSTRPCAYLAQYAEPEAWYTVGPHARHLRADRRDRPRGRGGRHAIARAQAERRRDVAVGRAGHRSARAGRRPSSWPSRASIPSACRGWATAGRSRWRSTSTRPSPICRRCRRPSSSRTATGQRGGDRRPGRSLEQPELTPADIEKKQSLWWFLFAAGAGAAARSKPGQSPNRPGLKTRLGFGFTSVTG